MSLVMTVRRRGRSRRLLFTTLSYRLDSFDYLGIAGAAAEVPGDGFSDLGFGRGGVMIEESSGAQDHSGGAETTLDGSIIEEGLLEWREPLFRGDSFDGGNLAAFTLSGQDQAGVDRPAVKDDSAGAAFTDPAAFFGAGEMEFFPEEIKEAEVGLDLECVFLAVNCDV